MVRTKRKVSNKGKSKIRQYKRTRMKRLSKRRTGKNLISHSTRLRAIGNSKGVIINNQLIRAAGINEDSDIIIYAEEGVIYLVEAKTSGVNTDLSSWGKQFSEAIKKGLKPEKDLFTGLDNEFDQSEW